METPGGTCLAFWGRGEALDLTSRMVLDECELLVLRQNEHIFNRKCLSLLWLTSILSKGRICFIVMVFNYNGRVLFLPSLCLTYSLVYSGC